MAGSDADSIEALRLTVETLEGQRHLLGDEAVELALGPVRARLVALGGAASAAPAAPTTVAERKVVTIVFADISGFTAMSERLDSESVHDVMNAVFDRLVPVIERYGGSIDKFIGDEIMALFGAPLAAEHHAEHALRACIELFDALGTFNDEHGTALGLHAGVNSGLVVAGDVGSTNRRDYSVMGDAVNVAARLEGASETGEILVGLSTYRQTSHRFEFEILEPLRVKGKRDAVPVFRLIGLKEHEVADGSDGGVRLEFLGRDVELARLRESILGPMRAVGVVGEPGLGKSRLVSELRESLVAGEIGWMEAHALEHRRAVSHGVIHDLIDSVIGAPPNSDPSKVSALLDDYLADTDFPVASMPGSYLRHLRGLPARSHEEEVPDGVGANVIRTRMVEALAEFISVATKARPAVLLVEDVHWADPSSLGVLRDLIAGATVPGLTALVTSRPDSPGADWIDGLARTDDRIDALRLGPLHSGEIERALSSVLVTDDAADGLRERVRDRVDGNPFFLVSFLRSLVDDGKAVLRDGVVEVRGSIADLAVPENLHAAVGARIDSVDARPRGLLRLASLLGRRFDVGLLTRLCDATERSTIPASIGELVDRQLIERRDDGQFQFVHAVVQEVAYEGMLIRERHRLHDRAARLLETDLGASSSEVLVGAVARHHQLAGNAAEGSRWFERAASLAAQAFANEEAAAHVGSALALADGTDVERRAKLEEQQIDLLQLAGRFDAAAHAVGVASPTPDRVRAARLARKLARTLVPRQRTEDALAALHDARTILDGVPPTARVDEWWREHFATENEVLWVLYMRGESAPMRARVDLLQRQIAQLGTPVEQGNFGRTLALLELREGRMRVGPATVERAAAAVAQLTDAGDPAALSFASFTHAFTLLWSGEIDAAHQALLEVLDLAQHIGDSERSLLSLTYLGLVSRFRHDTTGTEAFATAARALATRNGARLYAGLAEANLAWVSWRDGAEPSAVLAQLDKAVEGFAMLPGFPFGWMIEMTRMRIEIARGSVEVALAACERMLESTQQLLQAPVQAALEAAATERTFVALVRLGEVAEAHGYV